MKSPGFMFNSAELEAAAQAFLERASRAFKRPGTNLLPPIPGDAGLAEKLFDCLTDRAFTHLGKQRCEPYRSRTLALLRRDIAAGRPIRLMYDFGPGYHASLQPDVSGLSFDMGLAEWLALRQIALFEQQVKAHYAPGIHFGLVIDNLCGWLSNDVPLASTMLYVQRLRGLISQLGMGETVYLRVESEFISQAAYGALFDAVNPNVNAFVPTAADRLNVERFLGRPASLQEVCIRLARYERASHVTESLLAKCDPIIRLTQRATQHTLGFRAYPGGASRIQVGELVLAFTDPKTVRAALLTSQSYPLHQLTGLYSSLPGLADVSRIRYAVPFFSPVCNEMPSP